MQEAEHGRADQLTAQGFSYHKLCTWGVRGTAKTATENLVKLLNLLNNCVRAQDITQSQCSGIRTECPW